MPSPMPKPKPKHEHRHSQEQTFYNAYFFDLGGTLVALDGDEIACSVTGRVTLLPGVRERLSALRGQQVFVITNQAAVALGQLSEAQAREHIDQVNVAVRHVITDYRVCMHHPAAGCACRKPQPGMVLDLARAHALDLSQAVLVGDAVTDEQCARSAGVGTFLWAHRFFAREEPAPRDVHRVCSADRAVPPGTKPQQYAWPAHSIPRQRNIPASRLRRMLCVRQPTGQTSNRPEGEHVDRASKETAAHP